VARTNGDSWDLLNSVGATATAVAAQRAVATRHADPLISDPFAEPLLEALGADYYLQFARGELAGDADDLDELRAMVDSIAVRTRYFDDFFLDAMDAGVRQAVILASGLDTRAYRLPWVAGSTVFEVDQPDVIEFKTATLGRLGVKPPVRHRPLAVDLRNDWPAALRGAGFDPGAPTAWIAEGLLIYLPPEAGDTLFDDVDALSGRGSRIATEDVAGITPEQLARISGRMKSMRDGNSGDAPVDVADLWYVGERRQASDYLAAKGWAADTARTTALFGKYGLALPEGRVTPFGDPVYVTATR
jgi:methyltransferase (TIGR00027 family)